ncbi:MAG: hypothetical protein ACLSWI_03540 [Candidatus Gastranaerophilaceae bacterium]
MDANSAKECKEAVEVIYDSISTIDTLLKLVVKNTDKNSNLNLSEKELLHLFAFVKGNVEIIYSRINLLKNQFNSIVIAP